MGEKRYGVIRWEVGRDFVFLFHYSAKTKKEKSEVMNAGTSD